MRSASHSSGPRPPRSISPCSIAPRKIASKVMPGWIVSCRSPCRVANIGLRISMRSCASNSAKPIGNSAIASARIRHCRAFSPARASRSRCACCSTPIARTMEPIPSPAARGSTTPASPRVTASTTAAIWCNGASAQRRPSVSITALASTATRSAAPTPRPGTAPRPKASAASSAPTSANRCETVRRSSPAPDRAALNGGSSLGRRGRRAADGIFA